MRYGQVDKALVVWVFADVGAARGGGVGVVYECVALRQDVGWLALVKRYAAGYVRVVQHAFEFVAHVRGGYPAQLPACQCCT